jgi:hypothetical protein
MKRKLGMVEILLMRKNSWEHVKTWHKKEIELDLVVYTCNSGIWQVDTGEWWVQPYPILKIITKKPKLKQNEKKISTTRELRTHFIELWHKLENLIGSLTKIYTSTHMFAYVS